MARQKLAELEVLEKDQEREYLEEKRQADEAEARLKETRRQMRDLRKHLEPPATKTSRARAKASS
jgi:hypothetical protein